MLRLSENRAPVPLYLFSLIRAGLCTWPLILAYLEIHPHNFTHLNTFSSALAQLVNAGLVTIQGHEKLPFSDDGVELESEVIIVSHQWQRIQQALGISLNDLLRMTSQDAMVVTPYFGIPRETRKPTDLFVVMPFLPNLKPVYEDHITTVAQGLSLTFARGDDFFSARSVVNDIWNAIAGSKIIIADCTGKNPNVFYEIGIAHTVGRPVILITQNSDDVPFDIKHLRYIHYTLTPRGMKEFEKTLHATLITELGLPDQ